MVSGKAEKPSKSKNPLKNPKYDAKFKKKKKQPPTINPDKKKKKNDNKESSSINNQVKPASASQQLTYFVNEFQSSNNLQLSSLERESIQERSFLESPQELGQDVKALGRQIQAAFGPLWKETLCEGQIVEGKIELGSPSVLMISTSALRSIELLRGVRSLTKECHAAKLFSKHMRVEEQSPSSAVRWWAFLYLFCCLGDDEKIQRIHQRYEPERWLVEEDWGSIEENQWFPVVALLKNRVNFASGTPSRVKKLIDIEALGLSRLAVLVLDIRTDVKGYSLLTLPQVRDEFWDLYKNYFHQRLLQGDLRICLFGPLPNGNELRGKRKKVPDE